MDKVNIDVMEEVREIISIHTSSLIRDLEYTPESYRELYDFMVNDCGAILADHLVEHVYSPMEYNAIRNCLAKTLWELFKNHLE